ncbi:MAG TPA: hypothetical protein VNF47_00655 [Streptosporangiaceae bacterium]|nr:hypothetical protein [Streptosporangiaceae bacterium]
MTQRIPLSSISPDLRFALAGMSAFPTLGGVNAFVTGCIAGSPAVPAYLRYADRDAEIVAAGPGELAGVERELADRVRLLGESAVLDDLSTAVFALDAVDRCFRQAGLWRGNIYLAGSGALTAVLRIAGAGTGACREPTLVVRELAALELAYLFPVASKFRAGEYDGEVQFRLNGWGRALAARLEVGPVGAARAGEFRRRIARHLAGERDRYDSFLRQLDVARQDYARNLLDRALTLPIPVLV